MRIGVDCRLYGGAHAGIGRYVGNLVVRLPAVLPAVEWVYFFYDAAQIADFKNKVSGEVWARVKIVLAPIRHYTLKEQAVMPRVFARQNLDLLHVPHFNVPIFYRGKLCITIFDLLWHEYRGARVTTLSPLKYMAKYLAYHLVTARAVARARAIFYSAKVVEKSILKYYPRARQKLVLTTYGVDLPQSDKKVAPSLVKKLPTLPYLLYVGSLYPHKNIAVVLEALKKNNTLQLVLAGSRNVFLEQVEVKVKELNLQSQVTFLGRVSDGELNYLYKNCLALVQPSLSEGFGLTGVEAMGVGAPVIASDIAIFREVYGRAFLPFDPRSSDSFLDAVKMLMPCLPSGRAKKRAELIAEGKKVIAKYDWDKMVKIVAKTYEKII